MGELTQSAFAEIAGCSRQAVSKALGKHQLVRHPDGGLDPDEPRNAAWLRLHDRGLSGNGRAMETHSHSGRPAVAAAAAREAISLASDTARRNGAYTPSAAATETCLTVDLDDEASVDRWLAAELERSPFAKAEHDTPRVAMRWDTKAVTAFVDHVAKVTCDAVSGRDDDMIKLWAGFEEKLDAVLVGQSRLFELLSELTGLLARRW
jgi:hypothetical protein